MLNDCTPHKCGLAWLRFIAVSQSAQVRRLETEIQWLKYPALRNPAAELVRACRGGATIELYRTAHPALQYANLPEGSKGTRLRSLGRRPRAKSVAHFWLLLLHNKSNYPFRGTHADGQKQLK
jgi:hypothetical protein